MSKTLTINLPERLPHQRPLLDSPARFAQWRCGRRWGKTTGGRILVIDGYGPRDKTGRPRWKGAIHGKQIQWIAPTYGVASLIWRDLKNTLVGVWTDKSEVEHRLDLIGGGSITVRSGDKPDSLRGPGLDGVVFDEVHTQPSRDLWDVLTTSGGTREQPLIFAITTAGFDRHSICWEQHAYAEQIANGVVEHESFLVIFHEVVAVGPFEFGQHRFWAGI